MDIHKLVLLPSFLCVFHQCGLKLYLKESVDQTINLTINNRSYTLNKMILPSYIIKWFLCLLSVSDEEKLYELPLP